jgi:hypothetical protein
MLLGLFVAFLVAVAVFAWRVAPSPPSAPSVTGTHDHHGVPELSARALAGRIRYWTAEMADSIPDLEVRDLQKIPILMVTDASEEIELVAGAAERRLAETFPILRSATVKEAVREVLVKGVKPTAVQARLLNTLENDTLPFVVWVREKKKEPYPVPGEWVEVHFFYRGLFRYTVMNGTSLGDLEEQVKPEIAETNRLRENE